MLRHKIASCNALLHFVGQRYGAEPTTREQGEPRRSYTQLEYDTAIELGIPCYVFVLPSGFPFDRTDEEGHPNRPEPPELRALQDKHRTNLLSGEHIYQEPRDHDAVEKDVLSLRVQVEALGRELAATRKEHRTFLIRSLITLVIVIGAIGAGSFYWQRQTTTHVGEIGLEIDQVRTIINAVMSEEFLADAGDNGSGASLSPAKRFDEAVKREALKRGLDPEVIKAQIDQYTDVVARNRDADPLDRALARLAAGDHEAALIEAKAAVEALPATQPLRLAEAWRCVGDAYSMAEKNDAAIDAYRQALQHLDGRSVPHEWLPTSMRLMFLLTEEGYHEDALDLADEAFGLMNETGITTRLPAVSAAMWNATARIYHSVGDLDNAERFFELAYKIQINELPPRDPTPMDSLTRLAAVKRDQGHWRQAEEGHRAVLDRYTREFGSESTRLADTRIQLGLDLQMQGKYREAREQLEAALATTKRARRPEDSAVLTARYHLALLMEDEGRVDEAERELNSILSLQRDRQGEDHFHTLQTTLALARVHIAKSEFDDATALLKPAIERATAAFGNSGVLTLQLELLLSECLLSQGDGIEASQVLEQLPGNRATALAHSQRDRLLAMQLISRLLLSIGSHAEAEVTAEICLDQLRAKLEANHPLVLEAELHLAAIYDASEDRLKASLMYDGILRDVLQVTSRRGNTYFLIASQFAERGDFADAAQQFRTARATFEEELGVVHPWTLRALAEEGFARIQAGQVEAGSRSVKMAIEMGAVDQTTSRSEREAWRSRLTEALGQ